MYSIINMQSEVIWCISRVLTWLLLLVVWLQEQAENSLEGGGGGWVYWRM